MVAMQHSWPLALITLVALAPAAGLPFPAHLMSPGDSIFNSVFGPGRRIGPHLPPGFGRMPGALAWARALAARRSPRRAPPPDARAGTTR